jgi:biopolymer transport protein ExbD
MFRKRYRQQIPELNTTSTADISFMLLIFFLVTSSMDTEKGLLRQMAPPPQQEEQLTDINRDCVLQVELDASDQLTCNGKVVTLQQLLEEVKTMASVNREGHVVAVKADRQTSYEAYFQMQNAIMGAYASLRENYAQKHFGKHYVACNNEERQAVNDYYPQRISEDMKGGER